MVAAAALQHSYSWTWLSSLKFNTTTTTTTTPALFSSASNHHKHKHYYSPFRLCSSQSQSQSQSNDEESAPPQPQSAQSQSQAEGPNSRDPVKLAFDKAKAYKKTKVLNPDSEPKLVVDATSSREIPASIQVKMDKARDYNKDINNGTGSEINTTASGKETESGGNSQQGKNVEKKKEKMSISSIDFVGLNFADKKTGRSLPAGLVPVSDPFPEGDLPDVEIIVGDTTNFGEATTSEPNQTTQDNSEIYKPKVSTWGVFPRPGNISKTFGGGRTIRPGEVIETKEDRAAKDERTRQLLAAYKKKVGLNVDPNLRSECEKELEEGDSLMNSGKLKEALSSYERVMEKMPYKSELHGLAALQWSICQDSLSRPKEARIMYEKLQSHPNPKVSKRASQFVFSFKAMEMMKVTGSNSSLMNAGYQNYFEAFIEDKANYSVDGDGITDGALNQALPYMLLLLSPIIAVLFIAVQKGYAN